MMGRYSVPFRVDIMHNHIVSTDVQPVLFVMDVLMKHTVEVAPLCTYIVWLGIT